MRARVDNVRLVDMLSLLARLSLHVDAIDIIVDTDKRHVEINPIYPLNPNPVIVKLTDDNIDKLI